MKVILLEKIYKLGNLGDTVTVKSGYARNFLIPQGKAVPVTKENLAKFEARRAELEKTAAEKLNVAQKRAEQLQELALTIVCQAQEEGKLFGSVGVREIVEAIAAKGFTVEKREVVFPHGSIHEIGEHEVDIVLHSDVKVTLPVKVIAEE